MKKNRKEYVTRLIMTFMLLMGVFSTNIYAKECENEQVVGEKIISVDKSSSGKTSTTYELELIPQNIDENGVATYAIDSSFTMKSSYYRGADRKYSGNKLSYAITVTGANGQAVDKQVSAQLWDYNGNCLSVCTVSANGSTTIVPSISIVSNRTYYFKYYLATGSSSNLKIRMVIDTWE